MTEMKPSKYNHTWLGLILGIIMPWIILYSFFYFKYNTLTFIDFLKQLISMNIHLQAISICAVPNLLLFFIFIWQNLLLSARGVILATMMYAFGVIIIKYLL